jgi:hypothetical protein
MGEMVLKSTENLPRALRQLPHDPNSQPTTASTDISPFSGIPLYLLSRKTSGNGNKKSRILPSKPHESSQKSTPINPFPFDSQLHTVFHPIPSLSGLMPFEYPHFLIF